MALVLCLLFFFSAYLNVCRWIAVIDCCSRLQSKQRLNNKKTTKKHEREIRIRRPGSLPKWMEKNWVNWERMTKENKNQCTMEWDDHKMQAHHDSNARIQNNLT